MVLRAGQARCGSRVRSFPPSMRLEDLAGSPAVTAMFVEDEVDDLSGRLMRNRARGAAPVEQPARPCVAIPIEPLVSGVAADAVSQAELRHRPVATLEVLREMMAFEHRVGLLPGHRLSSDRGRRSVNHVPGHLSSMYPVCTRGASNMAIHPTVSRVTPPAKSGNRRAARPAGDGPR
jgi:hypothetical protein